MRRNLFGRLRTAPLVVALCCFSAAWIGDVWYAVVRQADAARTRALHDAARDAGNFARLIEEHTIRTIGAADQALQFVRYEYAQKESTLDLPSLLRKGVIPGDIANLYSIVGPDGKLVLASRPSKPINLADREHIRVHLESSQAGLFISKPVLGRITRQWSLQLTRRISHPDGSLAGVAVVSLDPFYFSRLYQSAQISPNSVVTLIGADGVVRARRSTDASTIGQDVSMSEQFRQIGTRPSGLVTGRSHIDGRMRMAAFRRLAAYPLLVVVGVDLADVEESLSASRSQQIVQAVVSTIGIVLFTAVLLMLARRLLISRAQAVNAHAAKTQFLSNMSHELRTPLNGILGYAELLKMDAEAQEHREYAAVIHASGLHLLSLVEQLLLLNRIESGQVAQVLAVHDTRALVSDVIASHHGAAHAKGIDLRAVIGAQAPPTLECDRAKVMQVLHELLDNAIKFTDRGQIEIVLEPADAKLVFLVTDTGPGIPAALQASVFDRFYQVDSSDSRANDGAGVGLTVARELAAIMGGEVGIRSTSSNGTTFYFSLPRQPLGRASSATLRPTEELA